MFKAAFRRLLALDDPPERTALAFAVGIFIAFSPFLGLHTILATALAFLFRFNKIAIYTGTFVNNPILTLVPIIIASYAVGAFLLGRPLSLPDESLQLLTHPHIFSGAYWRELFYGSWDVLWPFTVGGMILSVIFSLVSYPLTLFFLRRRRKKASAQVADEVRDAENDD